MEVISFDLTTSTSLTSVDWIFLPQHGELAPLESKKGACEQEGQKYTFWLLSESHVRWFIQGKADFLWLPP